MFSKQAGRTLLAGVAVVIAISAGVAAGRLPIWNQLGHNATVTGAAIDANRTGTQALHGAGGHGLTGQGVRVHGWWTIKVLDHGRVLVDRQFENSLVTNNVNGLGGDTLLAELLGGQHSAGPWKLSTADPNNGLIFVLSSTTSSPENGPLAVDADNQVPGHVILSGQYTPAGTVTIASVNTFVFMCGNTTLPLNCTNTAIANQLSFTSASLPAANQVTVNGGQVVQIKVDISFS